MPDTHIAMPQEIDDRIGYAKMQSCLHPELWVQVIGGINELKNYTGLNPMVNGNSLRGRIDAIGEQISASLHRQNIFFAVIAAALATTVFISIYITKSDSQEVQTMARQIATIAQVAKEVKP